MSVVGAGAQHVDEGVADADDVELGGRICGHGGRRYDVGMVRASS